MASTRIPPSSKFNLFILASWLTGNGSIPNASGEEGLYWGHILGGPLLGMGAVLMIGCEVRTYARLGMSYTTALAALPGFYVGYLPYTLYQEQIDAVIFGEGLVKHLTFAEWATASIVWSEAGWVAVYSLLMIAILVFSFETSRRFLRVNMADLLWKNTDELVYNSHYYNSH